MANAPRPAFFDLWSRVYDVELVQRAIYRPEQDAVLAALAEERPQRLLDLGCGTGLLTHRLRETFEADVVGCDFSAGMLHEAAARDSRVHWVRGDATRLPFADGRFDAVVSTQAFHWFPDQDAALREIGRVLRPHGRFVLSVVAPPFALVRRFAETAGRVVGQPFQWPPADELRGRATNAGFVVERQRRIFRLPGAFLLPPLLTIARRRD